MRGRTPLLICVLCAGSLLVGACPPDSPPRPTVTQAGPSPSTGPSQDKGLCQPFPDRLIDGFIAAYNRRNLEALEQLVAAEGIEDVVAGAYVGDATFADITEWAQAGWDAGDEMDLVGYGAFHGSKQGFQMHITRESSELETRGIDRVAMTLDGVGDGCSIVSLEMSGTVQADDRPCAFYDEFGEVEDVGANEPSQCRDGTGDFARTDHVAVWTGKRVLVWGGSRGGLFEKGDVLSDGIAFDPQSRQWSAIPKAPLSIHPQVGEWTGEDLAVLGIRPEGKKLSAAAYNPLRHEWRDIASPPRSWSGFQGEWTGSELIIWGGPEQSADPLRRGHIYDPETDSWRVTSPAPIAGRWSHAVAWTGTEMIVWGGSNSHSDLSDGAAYDPATDTWRRIPPAPLSPRQWLPIVWTGTEVFVWGGSSFSRNRADGAAYNPATDTWRKLPPAPIDGRHYHSAVWTGSEVIVFGGYDYKRALQDGAAYDPATNSWRRLPRAPISRRCCHSSVWTGRSMFVFGGTPDLGHTALGDGALYNPETRRWRRVVPDLELPGP